MSADTSVDVLIVGAGVVGLAVAESVTRKFPKMSVALIDQHQKFGQEASSHNSEVIHAGIYYPPDSLKAKLCIEGRDLLYEYCQKFSIPVKKTGKYIVATSSDQLGELEKICKNAFSLGTKLQRLSQNEIKEKLGNTKCVGALWSPLTGIVDSHQLMRCLEQQCAEQGAMIMYQHALQKIEQSANSWQCSLSNGSDLFVVNAQLVINCAGLSATKIFRLFEPATTYATKACRGRYFTLSSRWKNQFHSLIYPVPDPQGGLGVHLTMDLNGECRLGPDVDWSEKENPQPWSMQLYSFGTTDAEQKMGFHASFSKILPTLNLDDLAPGYVGVRCKLFENENPMGDFKILTSGAKPLQSIHCLGMESPGLTAALAIANAVSDKMQ